MFGISTSTFAQYATARTGKLAPKPANLSFEQAAAVPVSAATALQAVRDHGRVQAGEKVLIIGGNARLSHLRRALTLRGRLVIVGGETDGRLLGGSDRQIRAKLLSPFVRQQLGTFVAKENAADLIALGELIEDGKLTPAIDRTYSLAEVAAAIRHMLDGKARGKLVVAVLAGRTQTPATGIPATGNTP